MRNKVGFFLRVYIDDYCRLQNQIQDGLALLEDIKNVILTSEFETTLLEEKVFDPIANQIKKVNRHLKTLGDVIGKLYNKLVESLQFIYFLLLIISLN
jgi:hypothetical protein